MTPDEQAIMEAAVEMYGVECQFIVAMEECAELVHALTRFFRGHNEREAVLEERHLIEELADVGLMLDQIGLILGPEAMDAVAAVRRQKLQRLSERIALHGRGGQE